jgi:hypothetical protein
VIVILSVIARIAAVKSLSRLLSLRIQRRVVRDDPASHAALVEG